MDVDIISSRDLLPVVAVVTAVGGEQPFRQVSLPQHPGTVCNAKWCLELLLWVKVFGPRAGERESSAAAELTKSMWAQGLLTCQLWHGAGMFSPVLLCGFWTLVPAVSLLPPCAGTTPCHCCVSPAASSLSPFPLVLVGDCCIQSCLLTAQPNRREVDSLVLDYSNCWSSWCAPDIASNMP